MNEKGLQILEQYDIELLRSFGGRGAMMLETDQGLKLLKEFAGSKSKLSLEQQLLARLEEQHVCRTDRVVRNREGELLSQDEYETSWVLKNWTTGKECDTRNEEELLKSMRTLGAIHRTVRNIFELDEKERRCLIGMDRRTEFEKHNRELKRARSFIRSRHKKGTFELLFLKCAEEVLQEGEEALRLLQASEYEELREQACQNGHICHGEFIHHNILMNRQELAVVNFGHFEINVQVNDICLFLRKIMEKQNWNENLAERMLAAYETQLPLSGAERTYLAVCLGYPEKVWKLIHHYYHTNKAWIPEKSAEKLELFLEQEEKRRKFIRDLFYC